MRIILTDEPVLFETEGGMVVLRGDEVLFSQKKGNVSRNENIVVIGEKAKNAGLSYVGTTEEGAAEELVKLGVASAQVTETEKEELNSRKLAIMVKAGFAPNEEAALAMIREAAVTAAEESITETSSRQDLQLVHGIQGLDELDKFVNMTSERVVEWYGLHFPELQGMLGDNVLLCKIVVEVGPREKFNEDTLQGKGFSEKKIEALVMAATESKGGTVTERDMHRVMGLAQIAMTSSAEREKLAEYVESTMKKIAPNMTEVAGSTIGARLIAKAGGLDRIARLPASTIQVLGAEKALFRALRTGARPPKHGILFQHEAVHTAPKWQRGKIARALANKIAIAARIDYYRGEKEGGLTATLEKRLDEIKVKYKEQPKDSGRGFESRPARMRRSSPYRGGRREEGGDRSSSRPKRWHKPRSSDSDSRRR